MEGTGADRRLATVWLRDMDTVERQVTLPVDLDEAWELLTRPDDLAGVAGRARSCSTPPPERPGRVVDHDGTGAPPGRRRGRAGPPPRLALVERRRPDADAAGSRSPSSRPSRAPPCAWSRSWCRRRPPVRRRRRRRRGLVAPPPAPRGAPPGRRRRPGVTPPRRRRGPGRARCSRRSPTRPAGPCSATSPSRARARPPSWPPSCPSAVRPSPSTWRCCASAGLVAHERAGREARFTATLGPLAEAGQLARPHRPGLGGPPGPPRGASTREGRRQLSAGGRQRPAPAIGGAEARR